MNSHLDTDILVGKSLDLMDWIWKGNKSGWLHRPYRFWSYRARMDVTLSSDFRIVYKILIQKALSMLYELDRFIVTASFGARFYHLTGQREPEDTGWIESLDLFLFCFGLLRCLVRIFSSINTYFLANIIVSLFSWLLNQNFKRKFLLTFAVFVFRASSFSLFHQSMA